MCPAVVDAAGRQRIGDRSPRDFAAVAAEGVIALLIGGDERILRPMRPLRRRRIREGAVDHWSIWLRLVISMIAVPDAVALFSHF
jgi:hypothetical protein